MSTAVMAVSDISRSDFKCLRYVGRSGGWAAIVSDYRYGRPPVAFVAARSASPTLITITGTETGHPESVFPGA